MKNRRDVIKYATAIPALVRSYLHGQPSKRSQSAADRKKYLILACDGGGMRGYLSSLVMQKLHHDLDMFGPNNGKIDLYAGTSTGGLIALGLAHGKSIDQVVDLYKSCGPQVFSPLKIQPRCLFSAVDRLAAEVLTAADVDGARALWQVLFDNIGTPSLRTVAEAFIPNNPLLSSLGNKVMVATFQLAAPQLSPTSWNPLVIDNFPGSPGADTHVYDAALSTTAGPIYFPPYHHPQFGWCVDGGLFANNPSMLAVGRAIDAGVSLSDIVVLSIGTGVTPAALPVTTANRLCLGPRHWADFAPNAPAPAFPLLHALMDGASRSTDHLCGRLLDGGHPQTRYMRANPPLPKAVPFDDYSPATLQMLEQAAESYYATAEWTAIENWVKTTFLS
jgi:uncharacterized protein